MTAAAHLMTRPERDPHLRTTLWILAAVTLLRLLWLSGRPIDLYPDEAQYWIWAQHPAWGYFSKPPMVAWLIWASTTAFGDSDLTVKLPATITYFCTSIVVYRIAARLYDPRIAGWSAIAFITLPSVSLSSVIISTDVPLLFFWALATYCFVRAREEGATAGWWVALGLAAGLGLLSKYAMGFWLGSVFGYLLAFRDQRRHLARYLGAVALAILVYSPNFIWNLHHRFASYRHTAANADLHGISLHPGALFEFAASQFGVFGPVFAATLILATVIGVRIPGSMDRRAWFLLSLSLPTLLIMITESILARAQPNWSAPAYVTATIFVVVWLNQRGRDALVQWSVVLHVVLAVLAFGAHDIARAAGFSLPGKYDAVHRLRGWRILGQAVSASLLEAPPLPLMADSRELIAALIYYMRPHPFGMLIWNPGGTIHNGFEMTQSLPDQAGGNYVLMSDRDSLSAIERCFARYQEISQIEVPIGKGLTRDVTITALYGFKGYENFRELKPDETVAPSP